VATFSSWKRSPKKVLEKGGHDQNYRPDRRDAFPAVCGIHISTSLVISRGGDDHEIGLQMDGVSEDDDPDE